MRSRRKFIRNSSYIAAGTLILPLGCNTKNPEGGESVVAVETTPDVPLVKKAMGVQVYSVRDALDEDFEGSIGKLADIGYEYIEGYGLGVDGKMLGRTPQEYRSVVEDTGMTLLSSHCTYFEADQGEALRDAAVAAGLTYAIVPYLDEELRGDYHKVAENLNKAGAMFKEAGVQLGYHNHDFEIIEQGGEIPLEILLNETDPDLVTFQADLYWVTKGGMDPATLINKYPGRFSSFHVKDAADDLEQTTVGTGVIDFAGIFSLKDTAGMQHYFVEDERTDDPFGNLQAAYSYLSQADFN